MVNWRLINYKPNIDNSFKLYNASGVLKWTISVDAGDNLQFSNASGVVEAKLNQNGNLSAKGEITAYATI